jgi:lysophospholipase L1-like esterase
MRKQSCIAAALTQAATGRRWPWAVGVAAGALLLLSGCAAWRIGQSAELARRSEPLQQRPADATLRLLIVGDSTAVGTGAQSPATSLAGLIAREHPRLWIENRAKDGALLADLPAQLSADPQRFDIVLVQAGGNDVIRLRSSEDMRVDLARTVAAARERAPVVWLMPAGNVGNAPFFFPPLSWWMTHRARALHRWAAENADAATASPTGTRVVYVNLFRERDQDPFVMHPEFNASDGLHPSDAGYRSWWRELYEQAGLAQRLAAARR